LQGTNYQKPGKLNGDIIHGRSLLKRAAMKSQSYIEENG